MKKLLILTLIPLFLIVGCTPYQKQTWYAFRGGYSDAKLSDNSFSVAFIGNGWTSFQRASNFTLRRSAEVTLENGFNYFIIDNQIIDEVRQPVYGNGMTGVIVGQLVPKPSNYNIIICYKERPKNSEKIIYDAKEIIQNLKNKPKPIPAKS